MTYGPTELCAEGDQDDWRTAVVEYMELYTNETFASSNPDPSLQAKQSSVVGDKVGADLMPETVALPGLRFKAAHILPMTESLWARSPTSIPKERRRCSA